MKSGAADGLSVLKSSLIFVVFLVETLVKEKTITAGGLEVVCIIELNYKTSLVIRNQAQP